MSATAPGYDGEALEVHPLFLFFFLFIFFSWVKPNNSLKPLQPPLPPSFEGRDGDRNNNNDDKHLTKTHLMGLCTQHKDSRCAGRQHSVSPPLFFYYYYYF